MSQENKEEERKSLRVKNSREVWDVINKLGYVFVVDERTDWMVVEFPKGRSEDVVHALKTVDSFDFHPRH